MLDDGILGLSGIGRDDYAANPDVIKDVFASSFAEASPINHLDPTDADLRVVASYHGAALPVAQPVKTAHPRGDSRAT